MSGEEAIGVHAFGARSSSIALTAAAIRVLAAAASIATTPTAA